MFLFSGYDKSHSLASLSCLEEIFRVLPEAYLGGKVRGMTLNDYFIKHGTKGLRELAEKAGTKLSYLLQLNYSTGKRPSIQMAQRLVDASGGALTLEGLANPKKSLVREARKVAS